MKAWTEVAVEEKEKEWETTPELAQVIEARTSQRSDSMI